MNKLIGISGRAGAGKDTIADYLCGKYGFQKLAFAEPLKCAASAMFGIELHYFYDSLLKEEVIDFWGMSPRQMLQLLGTDAVKPVFGPDIWIKRFHRMYHLWADEYSTVVPDVRCDLEANFIRDLGGQIIHISRSGTLLQGSTADHSSEDGISYTPGDIAITNDGTIDDLYSKVDYIAATWSMR